MPVATISEAFGASLTRLEVSSPLDDRDVSLLPEGPSVIQFRSPLSAAEHGRLGRWFDTHPDAELRAYGHVPATLDFLEDYPHLGGFTLDCAYRPITDATGLRHLPATMRTLRIAIRLPHGSDLQVLSRLRDLRVLSLGAIGRLPDSVGGLPVTELHLSDVKTLEGITALPAVETLRLNSVTADLAPLAALELADLTLAIGGCKDLSPLMELSGLRRFAAWRVRGLADVGAAVSDHLEDLFLASLPQVTELPALSQALSLRRVTLERMRGLHDFEPLRHSPALEDLALIDMAHLEPERLDTLAGHPTLESIRVGLGSNRKNLEARDLIRIPGDYGGHTWPPPAV